MTSILLFIEKKNCVKQINNEIVTKKIIDLEINKQFLEFKKLDIKIIKETKTQSLYKLNKDSEEQPLIKVDVKQIKISEYNDISIGCKTIDNPFLLNQIKNKIRKFKNKYLKDINSGL